MLVAFRGPQNIRQSFRKVRVCIFTLQKRCFFKIPGKRCFHAPSTSGTFKFNISESTKPIVEISLKAWILLLKSLRKHEACCWNLSEIMKPFVKISMKEWSFLFRSLKKHEVFRWNLSKSMNPFVEISPKLWSPLLKSLWKFEVFCWQLSESLRCWEMRLLPFWEIPTLRGSCAPSTSATLLCF